MKTDIIIRQENMMVLFEKTNPVEARTELKLLR